MDIKQTQTTGLGNISFRSLNSILEIAIVEFTSLVQTDYPFIQYEFLYALETSLCASENSGWQPHHLVAHNGGQLVGFIPLYIKTHSYGEYVFDFQWANAYHQSGLDYYPKLLSAIPFTPCSGCRIITKKDQHGSLSQLMLDAVLDQANKIGMSSYHVLFPNDHLAELKQQQRLLPRIGVQFHWFNQNYTCFDDFFTHCKMKQRKNIKRERRAISGSPIVIHTVEGAKISGQLWSDFFYFYQRTYAKKSGNTGYLNESFFRMIGQSMPSRIVMAVAEVDGQPIAISLFFKDKETLYGRYWGCSQEVEFLHFELCYYQGIEYCIKNNLKRFDAGAQGEHKIQRGFKPIETYSYHWIKDLRFRGAIGAFLKEETVQVQSSIHQLAKRLPFNLKKGKQ